MVEQRCKQLQKVATWGVVQLLLERNADVNEEAAWKGGKMALQAASEGGHLEVVPLLLERNADVNAGHFGTPLQAASEYGHLEVVLLLLKWGADVNKRYGDRTALQAALEGDHLEVAQLLLEQNADTNIAPERYGYNGTTGRFKRRSRRYRSYYLNRTLISTM